MFIPRQTSPPKSNRGQEQDDDVDSTAPLLLARTRSREINISEYIVVPEIPPRESKSGPASNGPEHTPVIRFLVFGCAFLTSLSFGVTQVPLLYAFRLMTCDAYYEESPPGRSDTVEPSTLCNATRPVADMIVQHGQSPFNIAFNQQDRCSVHAIESSTALAISLLGASTTVFGIANLFVTGSLIKYIGVKSTLLINVFCPALRLLVQNVGVEVWGKAGIIIVQCSQVVSIVGGPSGYLLVLNTFITEVVEYEGRTAALGRLAGAMMFGSALGFLLGGVVADEFGIRAPFRLTLALFLTSSVYVAVFLPRVDSRNVKPVDGERKRIKSIPERIAGPLIVFAPRKFRGNRATKTEYGAFLLAWGVFLAILATGYLPTLLQLYSTDVFGFEPRQNGWVIFLYSLLRSVFLTFAFPKIIEAGRNLAAEKDARTLATSEERIEPSEREPLLSDQVHATRATVSANSRNKAPLEKNQIFAFDLTYTRFSILADAILTLLCSFVHQGWQMYLVAAILPFSAGTGSASKGTILQMVGSSASTEERADALTGISLVENMARLSTTFVFGVVFASFASIGRTQLVFTVNAAVALVGFSVLLFASFPPAGSKPVDRDEETAEESSGCDS